MPAVGAAALPGTPQLHCASSIAVLVKDFVVSDGAPVDGSTVYENARQYLSSSGTLREQTLRVLPGAKSVSLVQSVPPGARAAPCAHNAEDFGTAVMGSATHNTVDSAVIRVRPSDRKPPRT